MQTQARLASALDDGTIQRRLQAAVQEIGLPDAAGNVRIVRRGSPREIQIYTQYSETVDLPLFHHTRSEEHTSELQSQSNIVCRLLLGKKKNRTREQVL